MLTPKDYLSRYRALDVFVFTDAQANAAARGQLPPGGEWKAVDLHNYRLDLADKGKVKDEFVRKVKPHIDKKGDTISVWVKTVSGVVEVKTYSNKAELFENAVDTFYGKGSPEEVQVTLQLAVRYGVITKNDLQNYCDSGSIGLDCNGFVGNYLRHVKLGIPWHSDPRKDKDVRTQMHASQGIARLLKSSIVTPVQSLSDIVSRPESTYIMALCDASGFVADRYKHPGKKDSYGHVVLTNPNSLQLVYWAVQPWYKITVLESTGDGVGLVESEYNFLQERKKGIFKVYRGSKRGHHNDTMTVKIGRLL